MDFSYEKFIGEFEVLMPSGKTHEFWNLIFLIIATYILGHYYSGNIIEVAFSTLFILKWIWNAYISTPDLDTNSRPRKRIWIFGWIIDKLCTHGGILHNPIAWGVVFAVEYYLFGWWVLGGVFPIYSHLILDKVF